MTMGAGGRRMYLHLGNGHLNELRALKSKIAGGRTSDRSPMKRNFVAGLSGKSSQQLEGPSRKSIAMSASGTSNVLH